MRKNIELTSKQEKDFLLSFYNYFETGYDFESFLKIYLEKMGLDEVSTTQRSRDGGIDLKAKRYGIGDFSEADEVNYYVQAKRYSLTSSISVRAIRELKGTLPFGYKGIFITTSKFSCDAVKESNNDPSKPVILIDGKKLIESCIDYDIGVTFTPVFSAASLKELMRCSQKENKTDVRNDKNIQVEVEKNITTNDIRARILRMPSVIKDYIGEKEKITVIFSGIERELSVAKNKIYLAGVTNLYKDTGILLDDGSYVSKKAIWKVIDGKINIDLSE